MTLPSMINHMRTVCDYMIVLPYHFVFLSSKYLKLHTCQHKFGLLIIFVYLQQFQNLTVFVPLVFIHMYNLRLKGLVHNWAKFAFKRFTPILHISSIFLNTDCTGCFINSVTILNLYIIKISTSNCLTPIYYKNIMICILFGIKIDPYFHNLSLVCEN